MAKFNVNLRKLIPNLPIKYLIFIIIITVGCSYQIIQVTQVFLKFETKIDISYDGNNEIIIPMVSFCKPTLHMLRNSSQRIEGLSPAQFYNETFNFSEIFIYMWFIIPNGKSHHISNFTNEEQNNSGIYYEKTVSFSLVCFHFKYLHSKQLNRKQ